MYIQYLARNPRLSLTSPRSRASRSRSTFCTKLAVSGLKRTILKYNIFIRIKVFSAKLTLEPVPCASQRRPYWIRTARRWADWEPPHSCRTPFGWRSALHQHSSGSATVHRSVEYWPKRTSLPDEFKNTNRLNNRSLGKENTTHRFAGGQKATLLSVGAHHNCLEPVELVGASQCLQMQLLLARQRCLGDGECARIQVGHRHVAARRKQIRFGRIQRVVEIDVQPSIVFKVGLYVHLSGSTEEQMKYIYYFSSICKR